MILKNLPRGGKKPNIKISNTLFKLNKLTQIKVKKRNMRLKMNEKTLLRETSVVLNTVQNLRYSLLHTGMIVLGRIFKITDCYAIVSLPGQINGKLQATDISESYTNSLKSKVNNKQTLNDFVTLSNIYKEADYIICYIKDFHSDCKKVSLSLQSQLINQNLKPKFLKKGSILILNISSIEDHGYILETGLKNLRAFLSSKDVENKHEIYPGKQIVCAIKNIEITENIFTIKVSMKSKYLDRVTTNISSFDQLIPGVKFLLIIKKILKNGLQVYYGEKNIGYINQIYLQNILSSYEEGQELVGSLLYIIPIIKVAYFSQLPLQKENKLFKIGDIISEAKVISNDMKGILVQLKESVRGFIPLKRTEVDFERIDSVFIVNSIHKCKIIAYDLIAKLYICTMEKKLFTKKYINHTELQPGNIIEVTVSTINKNKGYIDVFAGKIFGIVPSDQISDPGLINKLKVGQNLMAKVLQSSTKTIFTLKKSLLESKLPILSKIENAKINSVYDGSIVKITNQGILIRFFGNASGWIPRHFLNSQTALQNWNFVIGQTVTTIIKDVNTKKHKITLAPLNYTKIQNTNYKIGDLIEGIVTDSSTAGVHVRIKNENGEKNLIAFLPAGHMSPCYEIGKILASKKVAGDKLSAIVFSTIPNIILSSTFAPKIPYLINKLNPGDIVLCSIKNILRESVKVLLPITKCYKYGVIPMHEAENFECLYQDQILFGKILKIDQKIQKIELTIQLNNIWKTAVEKEDKMMTSVDVLSCYLNKVSELSKNVFYSTKPISKIKIGERIKGTIETVEDYGFVLKLEQNIKGIVRISNFYENYKQGYEVEGTVLWVNYPHEYVEITLLPNVINSIKANQNKLVNIPIGVQLKGEIILITNWFVLVVLKGKEKGTLISLPVRKHLNDIAPDLSFYQIGNKVRCYGILNKNDANILLPICMLKSAFETYKFEFRKPLNSLLKRKMEIRDNKNVTIIQRIKKIKKEMYEETNQDIIKKETVTIKSCKEKKEKTSTNNIEKKFNKRKRSDDKDIFYKIENKEEISKDIQNINFLLNLTITECGFQLDNSSNMQTYIDGLNSSEKQVEESEQNFKKKNLLTSEKKNIERQNEKKIRECEEVLANYQIPQTVDQFDKLVLSNPDSSLIWIQYMAHYLQATELDKARIIAKRALKTINFREENEKLNIWQAWLNLESRYGTNETLTQIFQEAVKVNDAQKIYEHMLNVYINSCRKSDVEKIVNTMITKFKQNLETWISCGTAMLKIGMENKSREIMQRALQSLPQNKHMDLMVRFAQLENKFGEIERSQTLFEQILSLYPKRTDVWLTYVNSLIKTGEIEIARKILNRAIIQTLPARKMKILYQNYINFEEKYGTLEKVSQVKQLALKYVEEYKKIK